MVGKIGQNIILFLCLFACQTLHAQHWVPLPNDTSISVLGYRSLEVFHDTLILSGQVSAVASTNSYGSCAWKNDEFFPIGPEEPEIHSLLDSEVYSNELVVVGSFNFDFDEDITYEDLAAWNGTNWDGLDNFYDGPAGFLEAAHTFDEKLFVAGSFGSIADLPFLGAVAMWDGTQWTNPGGTSGNNILDFEIYNDTLIGAGASITGNDDGEPGTGIFYWDNDTTWHEYAGGINGNVFSLLVDSVQNDLYAGGYFFEVGEGMQASGVARWDGSEWHELEAGILIDNNVLSMCMYRNQLYASGLFASFDRDGEEIIVNGVMYFDGAHWQPMDGGMNGAAFDMTVYDDHLFLAGDIFTVSEDSIPVNDVVRWYVHPDSVAWSINELAYEESRYFTLYPNPNKGEMTIAFDFPNTGNLLVTDLKGTQVHFEAINNRNKLNLQLLNLPSGTYLCSYVDGGVIQQSEKLVIQQQ